MISIYDEKTDELICTVEPYELDDFFLKNLITEDYLWEMFDDIYGEVQTPVGKVGMGELMRHYLSETDIRVLLCDEADYRISDLSWYENDDGENECCDYGYRFVERS